LHFTAAIKNNDTCIFVFQFYGQRKSFASRHIRPEGTVSLDAVLAGRGENYRRIETNHPERKSGN